MRNSNKVQYVLDAAGLTSIGLFSLGYVVFVRPFAELHIQLPFLDFPIFVGEILLFGCLVLFLTKYRHNRQKLKKWHYLIICYFIFVLTKALCGYWEWGPLALRHSALLYYPVFIVFGYAFYRREFFDWKMGSLLLFLIVVVLAGRFSGYWTLGLSFLGFILVKSHPNHRIKPIIFLVIFLAIPYKEFFHTSRMMIVGNLFAGLYVAAMMPFILKGRKTGKLAIAVIMGGIVLLGLFKFANHNALRSIVDFERMVEMFKSCDKEINANMGRYNPEERRKVKLYNPDRAIWAQPQRVDFEEVKKEIKMIFIESTKEKQELQKERDGSGIRQIPIVQVKKGTENFFAEQTKDQAEAEIRQDLVDQIKKNIENVSVEKGGTELAKTEIRQVLVEQIKESIKNVSVEQADKEKISSSLVEEVKEEILMDFDLAVRGKAPIISTEEVTESAHYNDNAIFRLFIWRDMLADLINKKPILGFDFGKPLRSKSLEILHWGDGDWSRDGWIGAHNSYLHIIYRTGIVGVGLISVLLIVLFRMIRRFIVFKSLTGILLCGIIINWFVAANFLLIFELPYTAIPIWTIYGLTLAYYYEVQRITVL